ncbi:hypothetical protein PHLGIDRAFT_226424 [Phlebiopsis gigantea 11061_1 CR5-6]|uniref:DUF6534 domain-containing protein n=1 Tax=Phlebiopsis gigantea (strain 11061_1 CR5-6) TaxID=745531 RepID=A0A0C3S2C0_PHLG1|nr:hypothetical protein PHLGIDRAFT_226424 [Phlebiopsis gigantea 11061_1 CR5-6]
MVGIIWLLDFLHSMMVFISTWISFVDRFGDVAGMDRIAWSVGPTVTLTASVTFFSHCFFIHRIYILSGGNKWLAYPSLVLVFFRVGAAAGSTSKMIILASYSRFSAEYAYIFTMGLCAAVILDVINTAAMCYYLRRNKSGFSTMNTIIDALILYTVETGAITSAVQIATLACWLSMPNNLIFLGLHFMIITIFRGRETVPCYVRQPRYFDENCTKPSGHNSE